MRIVLLTTLILQATLSWAQPGVAPEREIDGKSYYVHKVEAGNTLWGLQQMYGTSVEEIMAANPELSSGLKTGQSILVPMKEKQPVKEVVTSEYKVKKGETLYGLSRKFNTTVDELIRLNPVLAESSLQKGQRIVVPGVVAEENDPDPDPDPDPIVKDPVPNPFIVDTVKSVADTHHIVKVRFNDSVIEHHVMAHETMYSISKRFMVPIETILKENNLKGTALHEGQVLRIPVKSERIEKLVVKPVPEAYDPNGSDPIEFPEKERYRIAVIAPFFFSHGKGYSSYISDVATQFYMGTALAIDTLKRMGFNADVQFYDSKRDSATILQILNSSEFANTDLVIGPFFPNTQNLVAEYCKQNAIRMIVPVSVDASLIEGNRLVYSAVPSSITLMTGLADFVAKNHTKDRVVLVKPTKKEDMPLYEAFRDAYNAADVSGKAALNETTMDGMKFLMTRNTNNVFVMPTDDRANAEKFVAEVSRSDFRAKKGGIYMYGTKEWVDFTGIHNNYKNEYNFRFASPNFMDYYTEHMIEMNKNFRARYKTDMSKISVQGYDVMLHGCASFFLPDQKAPLLMNSFSMKQITSSDGYENDHIYIVEQDEFELINAELPRKDD